jgi:hypothetical protein
MVSLMAVVEVKAAVSVAVEVDVLLMVTVEVWLTVVVRISVVVIAVETSLPVASVAPPDREVVPSAVTASLAEIVVTVTVTVSGPEQAESVALDNVC